MTDNNLLERWLCIIVNKKRERERERERERDWVGGGWVAF